MKAGEIEINILANYEQVERDLRQVERRSIEAGRRAGSGFKDEFVSKSQAQAEAIFGKFTGLKAAESLANGVANFLRSDKSIPEALGDSIKGIQWAGTFYNLGEAIFETIYDKTIGAADAAARKQARLAEVAYQEEVDAAAKLEEEKTKAAQEKAKSISDLRNQLAAAEADRRIQLLESTGRKEQAMEAKNAKEIAALTVEMNARVAQAKTEDEKKLIRDIYDTRINTANQASFDEIVQARIRAGEEARAKAEAEKKEQERLRDEQARKDEEEFRKSQERYKELEALSEDMARIEEERIQSQSAGITSGQTVLGTFRFDAYPDSMKMKNDQASLQKLEAIRQTIAEKAGFI